MTDTLFDIPETVPKWREIADKFGIVATYRESPFLPPAWVAEMFEDMEQGETEKEAVVALIHKLQLEGWSTVSL
jgi:hypothetical protein